MANESFNHQAAYITVRICVEKPKCIVGTGFLYLANAHSGEEGPHRKLLLISNKHVLIEGLEKMTVTLNRKRDDGTPDYGVSCTFTYDGSRHLYTRHPDKDVDLACVNVSSIANSDAYFKYIEEDFLTPINYEKVALGSEVLFVGYPSDYYDVTNNLPLVRKGTLASLPNIDFRGHGHIVIDAQVFEGSSGSPVFVSWENKYRLLGVISSTVKSRAPGGFPAMLGLGIVIKQRHVQELIDHAVNRVDQA